MLVNENYLDEPIAHIILNGEMLEAIQLKLEMRQGCPLCQILFHTVPKLLAEAIKQEKKTEGG